MNRLFLSLVAVWLLIAPPLQDASRGAPLLQESDDAFTFAIAADMREFAGPGVYDSSHYFRGAVEAIASAGPGVFMVGPGDIDPPANVHWTITQSLGSSYPWFPIAGNHETETAEDMAWLRAYDYGAVNPGPSGCPETTYSFDYGNAHYVMLNEYCDTAGDTATVGDVPDHLYNWLVADLDATHQENIFVFGHEPAYPQPDAENGRLRHADDSLNQYPAHRDRFWNLLKSKRVVAYICGHTHNYSLVKIDGLWQMDVGHARGLGDNGARSTFSLVHVDGSRTTYETYRDDQNGGPYTLQYSGVLVDWEHIYLPALAK